MIETLHTTMARQGFVRSNDGRLVGGVCSGIAAQFHTNPWLVRVLFLLLAAVISGHQLWVYVALWLVMPDRHRAAELLGTAPAPMIYGPAPLVDLHK